MLWICIALFFVRVIGQIEVLLMAPRWLPPMSAWYSGLLPYPILLPAQIALLMLMCVLVIRTCPSDEPPGRAATIWRSLALLYFLVMVVRLGLSVHVHGRDFYLNGAIPVAFHWVLALFLLLLTRRKHCRSR